ncbi:polyhydroxyalkanoic acid system family protein [Luteimonas wenzhouensis]|jgi:putative polyhydroxyalkanoate system protein|uniref:Polyhydroxyalkanoic acid synthase n=1 Tax=Luteimonas wenzhouensis TaxID=2599615 RepID=A0A5C5TT16_9GAMM|nr:polyhydroxyalkanoic acid system family protein [Luteimonas wenzhouensis]NLW96876.1 polyhydroxyalkanoic acid synthase [Xanthomonadaceae bacterium]TWT17361.1 polyhydroxyalkanoic acid synthase [Luteimonas wenzhouensis]
MAGIDIRHDHDLSMEQARQAVQQVADSLAQRFGVDCDWQGDTLRFNRPGVDGRIALAPRQVHVTASLGFVLSAMRGPIEAEIRRVLAERF